MTNIVKPYGDTLNDGKIQLSFALPVGADARGKEAARILILSMGFEEAEITCLRDLGEGFTHFIAYAATTASVDTSKIKVKIVETPVMDMEATDQYVAEHLVKPSQ
jgi:beta-lysine 5,6-aminomutase beta subunit